MCVCVAVSGGACELRWFIERRREGFIMSFLKAHYDRPQLNNVPSS